MSTITPFWESKELGDKSEKDFIRLLLDLHDIETIERAPNKIFPDWDIKIILRSGEEITYEVKRDWYGYYKEQEGKEGNIFCEFCKPKKSGDEPSGAWISKADYIVYHIGPDDWWICEREAFKTSAEKLRIAIKPGGNGNNAKGYIVKRKNVPLFMTKIEKRVDN